MTNNTSKIFKLNNIIQGMWMCITIILTTQAAQAQDNAEIMIANEYLLKGDKDKALKTYQNLIKDPANIPQIHNNYLNLLLDISNYKEAGDYIQRLIKSNPNQILYRADLGVVYEREGDLNKADKYLKALIKANGEDIFRLKTLSDYLASHSLVNYAILALKEARETNGNPNLFVLEMANLYRLLGKRDDMVGEYLSYVTQTPGNISYIKNLLQVLLTKPEELESLERILVDRVQQNPSAEVSQTCSSG